MADVFEQLGGVYQQPQHDPFVALGGVYRDEAPKDAKQEKLKSPKQDISPFMSAVTGFNTGVERLAHGVMQPLMESGWLGDRLAQGSKITAQQREADFTAAKEANPWSAGIGEFVGGAAPMTLIPGGVVGGVLRRMGTGALAGAGVGAGQYVPEGGSRVMNAITGGLLGGALPLAVTGISKGYGLLKGGKDMVARNMLTGADEAGSLATKQAANRLGLNLTPAEASGSPIAAGAQGRLGTSKQGAQALNDFSQGRMQQEQGIVKGFLDDVSPDAAPAANEVRSIAKKVISKEEKVLQKAAEPFYKKSESVLIPDNEFASIKQSNTFNYYLNKVKNDPRLKDDIADFPDNSVKVLDYVKKEMDDDIGHLIGQEGLKSNKAGIIRGKKNNLVSIIDKYSPDYAAARKIYSVDGESVRQLKGSELGKLADLSDLQLKNVSKTIFDPAQTDIKVLSKLRDKLSEQDPATWARIVRNEMERRLDGIGDYAGSAFNDKILKSDRSFNQFLTALKGNPTAQQKLIDMRSSFKNLIEPVSAKTAARLSKSSLDVPRSTYEAAINATRNFLGGKYDQAAIKFITSNEWDKGFQAIKKIKDSSERTAKFGALLGKISAAEGAQNNNQLFAEEDN